MREDDLQFQAFCLTGTGTRLDQYARALAAAVRPGDTVVDLGAGSGLLSILACRAGAARVFAIESGEAVRLGAMLAASTGLADRITVVRASSLDAVLPERADVIVADVHDTFGLEAGGLAAWCDARERFLGPEGRLVPRAITLKTAPVEAPEAYAADVDVWNRRVQGVDLSPLRPLAVNQVFSERFDASALLAPMAALATIDLRRTATFHTGGVAEATVHRAGTMHGLCGCFVTTLADGVAIGNVPGETGTSNFAQAFFPLDSPVPLQSGDTVSMRVDTRDSEIFRWQVDVRAADGAVRARFEHSTLYTLPLGTEGTDRARGDYRPVLTPRGVMERALLERFDGTTPASELERWLSERFGTLVPSRRAAAALLRSAIARCG